jgi:uncharacterized protein YjbI with pentapeptide repeats
MPTVRFTFLCLRTLTTILHWQPTHLLLLDVTLQWAANPANAIAELDLSGCGGHVANLSILRTSNSLRRLDLSRTQITDGGIMGVECIPSLEELNLAGCNFPAPQMSGAAEAGPIDSGVTCRGISGLEHIATLQELNLRGCNEVDRVSSFLRCSSLTALDLSLTAVSVAQKGEMARLPSLKALQV